MLALGRLRAVVQHTLFKLWLVVKCPQSAVI